MTSEEYLTHEDIEELRNEAIRRKQKRTADKDRITYACNRCGATDCKLWRPAQTFDPDLYCAPCVSHRTGDKDIATLDDNGYTISSLTGRRTLTLSGYFVPAVPFWDWTAYWGYLSIPEDGLIWWRYLPSFPRGA